MLHTPISTGIPATNSSWQKAFDRLDEDTKSIISPLRFRKLDVLDDVLQLVRNQRQFCVNRRWTYKTPGGRVIVLRDVFEKIAGWINKYKAIGDIAIQYDPVHAALPWAALRFLLHSTFSDVQIFGTVATTMETISRVIYRSKLLEDMYLRRQFEIDSMLEDGLVWMYSEILTLLSKTMSPFQPLDANEGTRNITILEDEVLKLAALADTESLRIIDAKTTELGEDTRRTLQHLDSEFIRLVDTTLSIKNSVDENKLAGILDWLSSVPISIHHSLASAGRIPNTGTWLMSDSTFQEWIMASSSSILLVHGIRGCGKSTLFSAVIDHFLLQSQAGPPSAPCAYFYCADLLSEPARASPEQIMRSIVRQIAVDSNIGIVDQLVLSAHDNKTKGGRKNGVGLAKLEVGECISLLQDLAMNNPIYIAIDSIDELREENRAKLVEALEKVISGSTSVVKVLLTSRDNTHIEALLESATKIRISPADNRRDVEVFVEHQLQEAIQGRRILNGNVSSSLRQKLSDTLTQGAGEMFLWAKLQLDFLCRKKTEVDILAAIEGGLYSELDAVYGQAFNSITALDPVGKEIVRQVFSWLLFSYKPMKVEAMRAALSTGPDIQLSAHIDLIDVCFNLIVVDSELEVFRFCHPSARDFMRQQRMFQPDIANQLIATACIRQCRIGPGESCTFDGDGSPVEDFYNYAGVYWPEHMRLSGVADQVDNDAVSEMIRFVLAEDQGIVNPAFNVWLYWLNYISSSLPYYHRLRGFLEPLQSPESSPLFVACLFRLSSLLNSTLEVIPNIDLEIKSNTGHTCMYLACSHGRAAVVSRLLEANVNPHGRCGVYGSPMHVACYRGQEDVVRILLRHGISAQAPGSFSSPFEASCRGGHERVAALLVKEQVVIQTAKDYEDVLEHAITAGFRNLVEWLTRPATLKSFGLDYPDVDFERQSVLVAIREGHPLILQSILRNKPHLKDILPNDSIAMAAHSGHVDMITYLHDLGMSIEAGSIFGSPLRCASLIGNERIVHLLISWGAKLSTTCLQAAAQNGHIQVMRMLISEGVAADHDSLQTAAYHGHKDAVRYLIRNGASMYRRGGYQSALHAAAEGGHEDVAALLIEEGYIVGMFGLPQGPQARPGPMVELAQQVCPGPMSRRPQLQSYPGPMEMSKN